MNCVTKYPLKYVEVYRLFEHVMTHQNDLSSINNSRPRISLIWSCCQEVNIDVDLDLATIVIGLVVSQNPKYETVHHVVLRVM